MSILTLPNSADSNLLNLDCENLHIEKTLNRDELNLHLAIDQIVGEIEAMFETALVANVEVEPNW